MKADEHTLFEYPLGKPLEDKLLKDFFSGIVNINDRSALPHGTLYSCT